MNRQVYLDHNASTPVHPEVVDAMLPYFSERFGNPSSVHGFGRAAREGLETAREQIAHFLRVGKEEIVFTSGGTESDNMAVKGVAMARRSGHIITSKIEHHAVLRAVQNLETMGFAATYLDVDGFGMVDPDALRRAIRPDTILISIMHANSEIGTSSPRASSEPSRASTASRSTWTRCRPSARCRSTWTPSTSTCSRSPATRSTGPRE
jgi:cysteine desulfurase